MILPTKHLQSDRSLIAIGAEIIKLIEQPKSISVLWLEIQELSLHSNRRLSFDWFTLAIAMLYTLDAVELRGHRLCRREVSSDSCNK
ncbi:ABC-three component system middle component 6 [Aeoliella mucimassa]|uniref:ABC-three component system middle component 6 n=1 Tax=Aeoliella mucimassa TaxID=2527972 RepID=UPI0036F46680